MSCHSHLARKLSAEKSTDSFTGFPVYGTICFSLAVFQIFSLTFDILIIVCLGVYLFGFIFLVFFFLTFNF